MLDFRGLIEKALAALEAERPADAEKAIRSALAMSPRDDQLLHLLGVSLIRQQREEEAVEPLQKAISLNRRDPEFHNALGCALRNVGRLAEGLDCFERALKLDPSLGDAHYNLGITYQRLGEFDKAHAKFSRLLEQNPQDVEVTGSLSHLQWFQHDFDGAIAILRHGIERAPASGDLRFLLGEQLLALGRYEEGWWHYLWRVNRHVYFRRIGLPFNSPQVATPFPASLEGQTVRVHAEQGIGDDLYFLRFAAALRARGARVEGWITPRLKRMVERSGLLAACHPAVDRIPQSADYVLLGDLPYLLETHRESPPRPLPLTPLPEKLAEVDALLAGLPRPLIGITWRAGTGPEAGNPNALYKEVPFSQFVDMAGTLPGTVLVLQRAPRPAELEQLRAACGERLRDLSAWNADLEGMLALLQRLEDYIGVSNTNMHLCAGLGRGAQVLVSGGVEFRWRAEGGESPWFPGFRVHRQGPKGDWRAALAAAAAEDR